MNHDCAPLLELKFPSLIGLNFNDLFTWSGFFNSSLFSITFYADYTRDHGILCACYSSAIGYLLNVFGDHFPCIDFTAPYTRTPLALNELLPSWFLKPVNFSNTYSYDMLRNGTSFSYPLMYSPETYGWWFLLQIKSTFICGLLSMNYFILLDINRDRTPVELPPKSQKYNDNFVSW